jgi:DNA helicase-2/ATP-dependent DNA helicase PcrA
LDFERYYKGTKDIVLHQNYRSTPNILTTANQLIKNNKQRIHKDLTTENSVGGKVLYYEALSHEIEAQWVLDRIRELKRRNPSLDYRDFAILYRSNYYSRDMENKCIKSGIPYEIYGGIRFFERKEVKDAISYMRVIVNPHDDLAFERIINTPKRGIGERSLEVLREEAQTKLTSMYAIASEKLTKAQDVFTLLQEARTKLDQETPNYADILKQVLVSCGYYAMIQAQDQDDDSERTRNVDAVFDYFFDSQRSNPGIRADEILQNIALISAQDEISDSNHISLMTVHTAKGLEFPFVFVIGLTEGVFPAQKSIAPTLEYKENHSGVEEERRLAYVAFTRAQKQLFLSCSVGYNYSVNTYGVPSRFLDEIKSVITPYYMKQAIPSKSRSQLKSQSMEKSTMVDSQFQYRPGTMVEHTGFGEGIVTIVEGDVLTIAFKDSNVGVKKISKNFNGLRGK